MSAIVRYEPPREITVDDNTSVNLGDRWAIALGEYADEGEPDVLVYVHYAVDANGNDVRHDIAGRVASAIETVLEGAT